jgi:hypothetical protein
VPGKPIDNAFIEAFVGRFRAECLNAHWFMSLKAAREKIEDWCRCYNKPAWFDRAESADSIAQIQWHCRPANVINPKKLYLPAIQRWQSATDSTHYGSRDRSACDHMTDTRHPGGNVRFSA